MTFLRQSLSFLFLVSIILLSSACGGGGGDEQEEQPFSVNACQALGLKVANAQVCEVPSAAAPASVVSLDLLSFSGSVGLCTGVVISPTVVLTAAHCFIDPVFSVTVTSTTSSVGATGFTIHPDFSADFDSRLLFNDVALVFLESTLSAVQSPILTSRTAIVGEEALIAGFGEERDGSGAGTLRAGNTFLSQVTPNHLFSEFRDNLASPCLGDSGGALFVFQNGIPTVAGIVSQTDPSAVGNLCREGDLTLYANTNNASVLRFIQENTSGVDTI